MPQFQTNLLARINPIAWVMQFMGASGYCEKGNFYIPLAEYFKYRKYAASRM